MKKINWKVTKYSARAKVGSIELTCFSQRTTNKKTFKWYSLVSLFGTYYSGLTIGPTRRSLNEAQEDAVRMTRELLYDYKEAVDSEMKHWE